jgi:uncharacterized damage-inducible protein DinB
MKRMVCLACGVLLVPSIAGAQAPAAAGQKIGLAASLQRSYNGIKLNLNEAANKLSDAEYSFRPSPEIRIYGGQFGHTAFWHYVFCSAAKGEPNPNQEDFEKDEKKMASKADVMKILADSFGYCDAVFSSLTDESAVQFVKQGQNEVTRAGVLANLIAHDNEEYGVITVYIRTKNMVPPSTERAQRGRGVAPATGRGDQGRGRP